MKRTRLFHNPFISILVILVVGFLLISWGSAGHYKINFASSLSFNQAMSQFNFWTTILANHASDADYRKSDDPDEAPRHFINIDDYVEFNVEGRIPQTLDSVISEYGASFVYDKGVLPWATKVMFDSLKTSFDQLNWDQAVDHTALLGHYVGDGHMPLHLTTNYNGQNTGNNGIHSRYESTMISDHVSQIIYTGEAVSVISDVNQYIFNYIYTNYPYCDSVLGADNYAKTIASNTNSTAYKNALWEKSKSFTTLLFKNASHAMAELIYTAWVMAGSPLMGPSSVFTPDGLTAISLQQNVPNPFSQSTRIKYFLPDNQYVLLEVRDISGKKVETLINGPETAGTHTFEWRSDNLPGGIYYLVLNTGHLKETREMVMVK
ncbi:MAG: T9SS type A sorting domain-containing protein [Bacteroidetes bacterium]|nr:T9SS type A sorting domain-containing protein [Bacteroidota bacterium]